MRDKRKVVVKLIESSEVHNNRLIEYLANKFNERGTKHDGI